MAYLDYIGGRGSAARVRLGGGSDSLGLIFGLGDGRAARPELAGRVEQGPTQVLQQPEPVGGHGEPAPADRGPVQNGPDQGEATGLAGESRPITLTLLRVSPKVLSMKLECRMRLWCSVGNRR